MSAPGKRTLRTVGLTAPNAPFGQRRRPPESCGPRRSPPALARSATGLKARPTTHEDGLAQVSQASPIAFGGDNVVTVGFKTRRVLWTTATPPPPPPRPPSASGNNIGPSWVSFRPYCPQTVTQTGLKAPLPPPPLRMSSGERPIDAAKGKQSDTEALCQTPPQRSKRGRGRCPINSMLPPVQSASPFRRPSKLGHYVRMCKFE